MKINNKIHYLAGNTKVLDWLNYSTWNIKERNSIPYDNILCEFLDNLSIKLMANKMARSYSDVVSFAFWCRKKNISKFKKSFQDKKIRLGLGIVFHIAPSNIPINFAYSFVFGLLSGNANIVRVPSKSFPQVNIICNVIKILFKKLKYKKIKMITSFVKYDHNDVLTGKFSSICNARIIWGGDISINNIRKHSIPEQSIEIAFADRYSLCVLNTKSISKLNSVNLKQLAERFYNDTYLVDQNACSSPHLIIWEGIDQQEKIKDKFWTAVNLVVSKKYKLADISAIDKYTQLFRNAVDLNYIKFFKRYDNNIYRVVINKLPVNIDSFRGRWGYFYEYNTKDINGISEVINNKYQTLTYYGFNKSKFIDFVIKNHLPGIDRIVPIGRALDMDIVWDGYDIIKTLTRIVDIK